MSDEIPGAYACAGRKEVDDGGCAFVVDPTDASPGGVNFCTASRQPNSPYCQRHHALCHLGKGGAAEGRQLLEIEALADTVGGRLGRPGRQPPAQQLRRLDRIARASSRSMRSRIVPREKQMASQR